MRLWISRVEYGLSNTDVTASVCVKMIKIPGEAHSSSAVRVHLL